jgi:U3 small nucleolar RNA-associated protein 14
MGPPPRKNPARTKYLIAGGSRRRQKRRIAAAREGDDDDDDEEIDEETAFNSDDERRYGAFFESNAAVNGDNGSDSGSENESGSDEGEDDEGAGEGSVAGDHRSGSEDEGSTDDSGSDDDSDDDDDDDDNDDDEEEEDEVEEDEDDGGRYMLDLLDKLGENNDKTDDIPSRRPNHTGGSTAIAAYTKESEFSASVIAAGKGKGEGGKGGGLLTLDDLLRGGTGTDHGAGSGSVHAGFGTLQKQLRKVAEGSPTQAPLSSVVSRRIQRGVHYQDQSREVSGWLRVVQENRQAETLDFRPKHRMDVTKDSLVESFVPTTDFERAIQEALVKAGQEDEGAILRAEQRALYDDLGAKEITLEEYRERRGQLAKMRALMLYRERKNHQIKKIKSKTYRRIRKRKRERVKKSDLEARIAQEADHDDDALIKELEEKEEVERMKERMTLAHKNTSKWARRVLKRGKAVDVDTRRALSAQLKRGDDLLQRMSRTRKGADESDEDDSDEDPVGAARRFLAETEADKDGGCGGEEPQGLFKLAFMQKGIERQRQQARDEARELLRELEEHEHEHDGAASSMSDAENEDEDKEVASKPKAAKPKVASKEEMKDVLGKDEMVAQPLKLGNTDRVAVSGDIPIDLGYEPVAQPTFDEGTSHCEATQAKANVAGIINSTSVPVSSFEPVGLSQSIADSDKNSSGAARRKRKKPERQQSESISEDANPWLPSGGDAIKSETKHKVRVRVTAADVERAIDLLEPTQGSEKSRTPSATKAESSERAITDLSQEQLVRMAFATVDEKEIDEEFAKEKQAVAEEEDPTTKERNKKARGNVGVGGWGSWAGKGAPPSVPPRNLPKKLQAPEKKLPPLKRADEKRPHVILSEKRLKRLADSHMIAEVPYPFTSREEYERSMAGGVGREWNVTDSFKDMTRPEILTRAGKMIQPLSIKVKQKRPAAKF